MTEQETLARLQKAVELIYERLDVLENRANDLELNNGSISGVLRKIENGFSSWKDKQDRAQSALDTKIETVSDNLKLNTEGDKGQNSQISSLEDQVSKLFRQVEGITDRMGGGYEQSWSYEQIRSTVRNSAFTGTLLKYLLGLVGVSGVGGLAAVIFGFGQVDEQEFTYLSTHLELQDRVDELERDVIRETSKWSVIYQNLDIEIEPTP